MIKMVTGAASGLAATLPIEAALSLINQTSFKRTTQPVSKRKISNLIPPSAHLGATILSHFGYGAIMGALYTLIAPLLKGSPIAKGASFGTFILAASYMEWLPTLNLQSPLKDQPRRHRTTVLLSYLVWGASVGWTQHYLQQRILAFLQSQSNKPRKINQPCSVPCRINKSE